MTSKNQLYSNPSDTFIGKVNHLILVNLDQSNISPDFLSRELKLSKMQIYRKIKSWTGKSTAVYIRYVRLSRSKHYLTTTDWPISQIAYEVGFQNHSYFTRTFNVEFGISPSKFRQDSREYEHMLSNI